MTDSEKELDWISDCLFAVFRAPTWVAPIAKFIDENCNTFEDLEENKLEYTPIFNSFKQLVDDLLSAHLLELSVTQEQFERFCAHGLNDGHELHRSVVEQLLSVDDFLVFKAMMVKRSAELHLQVLQPSMHPEDGTQAVVVGVGEESIGEAFSADAPCDAEEEERLEAQKRIVEAEMQLAVALSLQLEQRLRLVQALEERLRLIERLTEVLEATAEVQRQQDEALAQQLAEVAAAAPEQQEALTSHQQQMEVAKQEQQATYQIQQQELSKQLVADTGIPKTVRLEPLQGAAQHTLPVGVETPGVANSTPLTDVDRWELEKKRSEATLRRARAPAPAASAPRVSASTAQPVQPCVAPHPLPSAAPSPKVPTEDEKRARAEHLKKQRELLIEKRNRERATSLAAHQQTTGSTLASRVAERACAQVPRGLSDVDDGRRLAAELSGQAPPVSQEEAEAAAVAQTEEAAAAMRRTITQQLKQSLVGSLRG